MEYATTGARPVEIGRNSMIACVGAITWALGYSTGLMITGQVEHGLMMLINGALCMLLMTYQGGRGTRAFCLGSVPAGTMMIETGRWLPV